jgi:hypothetical protein
MQVGNCAVGLHASGASPTPVYFISVVEVPSRLCFEALLFGSANCYSMDTGTLKTPRLQQEEATACIG